jgi:hypothetical protein
VSCSVHGFESRSFRGIGWSPSAHAAPQSGKDRQSSAYADAKVRDQVERYRIHITVRDPPGGPLSASDQSAAGLGECDIEIHGQEPLRAAVVRAAAPLVERWFAESDLPFTDFQPALAVGSSADTASEIGQGFTVTSDGRVRSTFDVASEPFADLLRAYELGLIGGDPRSVYVWRTPSSAGVGGAAWDFFSDAIKVLGAIGGTYAGSEVIAKAIAAFRRTAEVLIRHQEGLQEHGFAPPDVLRLAARRRWTATDLAAALDMTVEEVVILLEGLGFEQALDGTLQAPRDLDRQVGVILLSALTGYEAAMNDADAVVERCRRDLAQVLRRLDQN